MRHQDGNNVGKAWYIGKGKQVYSEYKHAEWKKREQIRQKDEGMQLQEPDREVVLTAREMAEFQAV